MGIEQAMKDSMVNEDLEDVIHELWKAGWDYDEEADTVTYCE